jgi:molybdopterin-guanine dinucleotide biosynthesis protein A
MLAPAAVSVAVDIMPDLSQIAGVVLAGGKSSRMGRNKAFLEFKGRPLIQHMMDILRDLGLRDIYVSGSIEGYSCIDDESPFAGPAQGIRSVLQKKPDYKGYLFIPVDMPFLKPEILQELISQNDGGYFIGWPLPLFLVRPITMNESASVQGFIEANSLYPVDIPPAYDEVMVNINTPQEWKEALLTS